MNLNQLELEESAGLPAPRKVFKEYFDINKTHTPIQLMLAEHEKHFNWTTKTAMKDRTAYYALAHKCLKEKGESKLKSVLNWGREKRVHIKALLTVLSRSSK